jgi:hypothetical protein
LILARLLLVFDQPSLDVLGRIKRCPPYWIRAKIDKEPSGAPAGIYAFRIAPLSRPNRRLPHSGCRTIASQRETAVETWGRMGYQVRAG